MRPRVTIHNEASVDGRMDIYTGDIGVYYEIASRLGADASLAGGNTSLMGLEQFSSETEIYPHTLPTLPDAPVAETGRYTEK